MGKSSPKPMHFEEADEDGSVIPGGTKHYARSNAPGSPSKERPNTGRSRRESKRRDSTPPIDFSLTDPESDSTAHASSRRNSKMKSKEDRKGSSSKSKTLVVKERDPSKRPAIRSSKSTQNPPSRASDESSYYGVHQKTIATSRPRSHTRPLSYHGRPPLSGSAYYHQPPPGAPQGYPLPPSFPPPPPSWGGPPPMPIPGPPMHGSPMHPAAQMPGPSPDFIRGNRELSSRFERPQSAMGYGRSPQYYDHEPMYLHDRTVARRSSVSRKVSKDHDDRRRMPPPPRPASTVQSERTILRAPPPRKSVGFEDDDLLDTDPELFQSISRRASVEYGHGTLQPRARRDSFSDDDDESYFDDHDRYQMEPASTNRRASSYNYEDKIRNAAYYQNDVSGPAAPLTAETLKRVKNGGSKESTRSSGSRDESDYKHSATTRTTRSASAEDDITIKLPEGAVVEVNGARITCPGGGDVNIGRNGNNGTSRAGSDRATSIYEDDRKSRHDRLPIRTRASSQAAYPRSVSHAPPLYPHGYPPYPGYPGSYYEQDSNYF